MWNRSGDMSSLKSLTDEQDLKLLSIEPKDNIVHAYVKSGNEGVFCGYGSVGSHDLVSKVHQFTLRVSIVPSRSFAGTIQRIGVLTSGGDAHGMNAAIRAVVRAAVFHGIEVTGIFQGYEGLMTGDLKRLHARSVAKILGRGGTILKSARCMDFMRAEGRAKGARGSAGRQD